MNSLLPNSLESKVHVGWFRAAERLSSHHSKSSLTNSRRWRLDSEWTVAFRTGVSVNSTMHGWGPHGDPSSSRMVTLLGVEVLRMVAGTKRVT